MRLKSWVQVIFAIIVLLLLALSVLAAPDVELPQAPEIQPIEMRD